MRKKEDSLPIPTFHDVQKYYFHKTLKKTLNVVISHIQRHIDCHEESNLNNLLPVFEYYNGLDKEEFNCGRFICLHTNQGKFQDDEVFQISCLLETVYQLIARFTFSIRKSSKCQKIDEEWELNKYKEDSTMRDLNIYWPLMFSFPGSQPSLIFPLSKEKMFEIFGPNICIFPLGDNLFQMI